MLVNTFGPWVNLCIWGHQTARLEHISTIINLLKESSKQLQFSNLLIHLTTDYFINVIFNLHLTIWNILKEILCKETDLHYNTELGSIQRVYISNQVSRIKYWILSFQKPILSLEKHIQISNRRPQKYTSIKAI